MKEQIYQAREWDSGKPVDIILDESDRREWQKHQMKNDGMDETGAWLEFIPVEESEDPVAKVIASLRRLGITAHELGDGA